MVSTINFEERWSIRNKTNNLFVNIRWKDCASSSTFKAMTRSFCFVRSWFLYRQYREVKYVHCELRTGY